MKRVLLSLRLVSSRPVSRRGLLIGAAAAAATATMVGGLFPSITAAQIAPPVPPVLAPAFLPYTIPVTDAGVTLDRTFLAHIPLTLPLQQGLLPAVIVFHGGGQDGSRMVQHWDSMVGQFVMVCPNARFDPLAGETRWQVPRVGDLTIPTVDLAFVEALLAWLAATGRVDMQRVYASGFSSGAAMTWQLTVLNRSVNRFRGFAPVSHVVNTTQVALGDAAAMNTPKPLA
jgi:poly(3-hydroxybutyrate) depolymerase